MVVILGYANDDQANSPIYTKYPMNLPNNNNNSNRDSTSPSIYPKTNSNIQSISWINVNDNDLPWKFTLPSRNSFSNGIRRLSSFFRSFNQSNGSFTPPRYHNNNNSNSYRLSYKKSSLRSSSFNTSRTEMMPSMPVLPTFNYLTTSNNNNSNSGNIVPLTSHYPVNKQHFDSFRLNGRHVTHPLMQPALQSMSGR
ncbi:unnamed protein product [Schistosoma haematobium]|nr:unnamed protein product [Schistosoma haematobium]